MVTIRTLLSIVTAKSWDVYPLDINNAFLHGDLPEEVYMELSKGHLLYGSSTSMVCKLNKSIYGLKQASKQWFEKLGDALISFGFHQTIADYSLFVLERTYSFIITLGYVDDILLT